jgi:hypothetical protein
MSPFDIDTVVFHFDDFNYGRPQYLFWMIEIWRRTFIISNSVISIYHYTMTLPILSIKQWLEKGIFNLSMFDEYGFIHFSIGSSTIMSASILKTDGLRLSYSM